MSKDLIPRMGLSLIKKAQELFVAGFQIIDDVGASLTRVVPQGRQYTQMIEDVARRFRCCLFEC